MASAVPMDSAASEATAKEWGNVAVWKDARCSTWGVGGTREQEIKAGERL
jgi:hypothetical protein